MQNTKAAVPLSRILHDVMYMQQMECNYTGWESVLDCSLTQSYIRYVRGQPNLLTELVKYHVRARLDSLFN